MYSLITLIIDVTDNIYQSKPYSEMQQENREKQIFQKGLKFSADYRLHKNVTKKKNCILYKKNAITHSLLYLDI